MISSGSQGFVWQGTYERKKGDFVDVAIKQAHMIDPQDPNFTTFLREIKVTSLFDHPNINDFYGIVLLGGNEIGMVSRYRPGTLRQFLQLQSSILRRLDILIDVVSACCHCNSNSYHSYHHSKDTKKYDNPSTIKIIILVLLL